MESFNNKFIYITLLCAIFCFAWSTQDKPLVRIPVPAVLVLRQQAEKCALATGVPASHLKKIIDRTLPNDAANKQFFQCVCYEPGYIDKDGHFVTEKLATLQVEDGELENFVNVINECNKIVKEDVFETLVSTAECVHNSYDFAPAVQQ